MSTNLDSVGIPLASRAIGSEPALLALLASVRRRKLLVLGITAAALVLGIIAVAVMPARYEAQAYIRGEFVASDTLPMQVKNMSTGSLSTGPMSLDPVRVIETQSRLLQSNRLARRVVEQLGFEQVQPVLNTPDWSQSLFKKSAAQTPEEKLTAAGQRLLSGLTVTSDPRAYLITVRYTTGDPELSILIANAFVAELLRSTRLQMLSQQRSYAQATLSNQLAKFGEKHPKVGGLRSQLTTTEASLQQQMHETPDSILQSAGENVTKAIAAPSGLTPVFTLCLALLVGLVLGIGVALWLERHRSWPAYSWADPSAAPTGCSAAFRQRPF